jgi:hypothetical protein
MALGGVAQLNRAGPLTGELRRAFIWLAVAGDRDAAPRLADELGGDGERPVKIVGGGAGLAERDLVRHAWALPFERPASDSA